MVVVCVASEMALFSCTYALSSLILRSSANELNDGEIKRKKLVAHSVQTCDDASSPLSAVNEVADATDDPSSAHYWRDQAEKQRVALEAHLRQNERLHIQVASLKSQLDEANRLLDDSKVMAETLTELLQETEAPQDDGPATDGDEDALLSEEDERMIGSEAAAREGEDASK